MRTAFLHIDDKTAQLHGARRADRLAGLLGRCVARAERVEAGKLNLRDTIDTNTTPPSRCSTTPVRRTSWQGRIASFAEEVQQTARDA